MTKRTRSRHKNLDRGAHIVLQRAGSSHSMPIGTVVATAILIECMQV